MYSVYCTSQNMFCDSIHMSKYNAEYVLLFKGGGHLLVLFYCCAALTKIYY